LKEIVAPSDSNLDLIASASSNLTFSLIKVGAFSTKSLASLSPSPRSSLTALITQIFCCPISVNSILTISALAEPASSDPPAAHPATTIAAALTPNSSSIALTSWFISTALISLMSSSIFCAFFDNSISRNNYNIKIFFTTK